MVRAVEFVKSDDVGFLRDIGEDAFVIEYAGEGEHTFLQRLSSHLLPILQRQPVAHPLQKLMDDSRPLVGQQFIIQIERQIFAVAGEQVPRLLTQLVQVVGPADAIRPGQRGGHQTVGHQAAKLLAHSGIAHTAHFTAQVFDAQGAVTLQEFDNVSTGGLVEGTGQSRHNVVGSGESVKQDAITCQWFCQISL